MDEELGEGRGRSRARRRPARVEADGSGVKADSWPEGSPKERRGLIQSRLKGQKEEERQERQEREEEKREEGKKGEEEAGGLREWGLLDGEAQWSSTVVGLGEEVQGAVRRDRPGWERKSEETREPSSSKILEERKKGQELFKPEPNKFGVEQSPGGGSQRWGLHGDLQGEGSSRAIPGSTCPRSPFQTMGDQLLHERGESSGAASVRPTAFPYYRQQLARRLNGPASREAATLAMSMNFLMKGRPSHAMDVLAQRLKSIEASASGSHWQVCQRMELVPQEQMQIARPVEIRGAQKETYDEARTQWLSTLAPGGKGKGKGQDGKFNRKGDGKRDGKDGKDGGKQKGDKKEK